MNIATVLSIYLERQYTRSNGSGDHEYGQMALGACRSSKLIPTLRVWVENPRHNSWQPQPRSALPVELRAVLLYSTNTALKFRINRDYLGGVHYCWCSKNFDAKKIAKYARGAGMPPSSDPCSIYRELRDAVQGADEHCEKIRSQRANLTALATKLHTDGKISENVRDEIVEMVKRASFPDWTPYLYVIPSHNLGARVIDVPREKRASSEMEYIVEDLAETEFDILEFS